MRVAATSLTTAIRSMSLPGARTSPMTGSLVPSCVVPNRMESGCGGGWWAGTRSRTRRWSYVAVEVTTPMHPLSDTPVGSAAGRRAVAAEMKATVVT